MIIPQTPAVGILLNNDWGDSVCYTVACNCGCNEHEHSIWVEADDSGITVSTYTTQKTDWWTESIKPRYDIENAWVQNFDWTWKGLWNSLMTRIRLTTTIWFKGYVKYEASLIMSEQQALNYAEELKSAISDVQKFRSNKLAAIKQAADKCII